MRKKILFIALALVMMVSLSFAGCSGSGGGAESGGDSAAEGTGDEATTAAEDDATSDTGGAEKYKFGVVVQAISGDFTNSFIKGAEDAAKLIGCEVEVTGPEEQKIDQEVSIVETMLESDIDGIAVVAGDKEGFRSSVDLAESKGIPFVTFNMDDGDPNDPGMKHPGYGIGYAGAVEYNFAYLFAEKFFNDIAPDVKNYLIATADPALPVCVERATAIRDVAKAKGIKELETVPIGYDFNEGYSAVENALTANPDVEAIVGTDHFSQSIANVVGDQGLGDKIKVGCFDPLPGTIARLETGDCDLIADQNPYLMAYYSIINLYSLKTNGSCAYNIDTGAFMWTQDLIEDLKVKYDYKG
ncbi:MAG: substrate-binding domain-containing protein [Clostridiales Family XIII bacterium]|jgi:ABC-type sugar transport system substrate-binding protein|nr:substrate-binding domain-containing protein [Clostridiales Family XIII bacterium]